MSNSVPGEKDSPPAGEWRISVRSETADLVASGLIVIVAAWYIVEALGFPARGNAWVQAYTFPVGIGTLAIITSLVLGLQAIRRIYNKQREDSLSISRPLVVLTGMICIVVYATLLDWIGFYPTSALFTLVFGYAAGIRKLWGLSALTLGFLVFTKLIFDMALGTPLPTGTWL